MTEPTHQDRENARRRHEIALRFRQQYEEARAIVESVLGPGFIPTGRHFLVSHDEEDRARATSTPMIPAATVITARNGKVERHLAITDYNIRECADYRDGFGAMLTESDPKRTTVIKGETVALHRFSLYWAGFDPDYAPQSAEQLAAAREKREQKAHKKWEDEVDAEARSSLFPAFIKEQAEQSRNAKKVRKR